MKKVNIILSKLIDELRTKNIDSSMLSAKLGVDERTIKNKLNGETPISLEQYMAICEMLEVNPDYFFDGNSQTIHGPQNCFILANNDHGTIYFHPSDEQMNTKK